MTDNKFRYRCKCIRNNLVFAKVSILYKLGKYKVGEVYYFDFSQESKRYVISQEEYYNAQSDSVIVLYEHEFNECFSVSELRNDIINSILES